jgi:hypothetical protein
VLPVTIIRGYAPREWQVSYDHFIYFGADGFTKHAYDAFVANSLRTLGSWHHSTSLPLDLGRDRSLHDYRIEEPPGEFAEADWEKGVGVWVGLRRSMPDWSEPELRHFPYYILVETGAGRSPLSLAIQFMVAASAFNFLNDAVVVDDQSEDPENLVTYRHRSDFVRHIARVFPRLYDWDHVRHGELLDEFWADLRRELGSDVRPARCGGTAGGA